MKSAIFALVFLAGDSLAPRHIDCTSENPQVATLRLDGPGPVRVYRRSTAITVGSGAPICLGDTIPASTESGVVEVTRTTSYPFKAGFPPRVPTRREGIIDWLRSAFDRARLFDLRLAGAPMGDGPRGFALSGLTEGTARLAPRGTIRIPVLALDIPQSVELYAPGTRTPLRTVRVAPRASDAVFAGIRPAIGRWVVVIDADGRTPGAFDITDLHGSTDWLTVRALGLDARETALSYACLDPIGHALESYNALAETGRRSDGALLLSWQRPGASFGCSTPAR